MTHLTITVQADWGADVEEWLEEWAGENDQTAEVIDQGRWMDGGRKVVTLVVKVSGMAIEMQRELDYDFGRVGVREMTKEEVEAL